MFEILCIVVFHLVASTAQPTDPLANCGCKPVGVANRGLIKGMQMTSSSVLYSHLHAAQARFNNAHAWCPQPIMGGKCDCPQNRFCNVFFYRRAQSFAKNSKMCKTLTDCKLPASCDKPTYGDWLQVDLGRTRVVCGVATQGKDGVRDWASLYFVKLSRDGKGWYDYKENGTRKIFKGNADTNIIVKNFFRSPTIPPRARFIRFYPQREKGKLPCMKVEVLVKKDPLKLCDSYRTAWTGKRLWLQCIAQGKPAPIVSWLKDGKPVTSRHAQKQIIVFGDQMSVSLVISHIISKDEGKYSCLIKDHRCPEIIRKEKTYYVNVVIRSEDRLVLAGGARFLRVRQNVTMGGQLTLNCTAWYGQAEVLPQFRRRPATAVFWHKEWKPLARNRAQTKVTIYRNEIRASLVIPSVTCHDVGWYHCMVINDFPKNVVQTMFRVQVKKHGLVMVGRRKVRQNVLTDGRLSLRCIGHGEPAPNVTWFKDGRPVIDNRARNQTIVNGDKTSASLVISPVTCQDTGLYKCLMEDNERCPSVKDEKKFIIRVFERNFGVPCKKRSKQK